MNWVRILKLAGIAVGLWVAWWTVSTFAASEETQMLRVQEKFLRDLEKRKWGQVDAKVCADYMDEWGQDKAMVQDTMRQLLGGFFFLSIEQTVVDAPVVKGQGYVKSTIRLDGNGAGVSSIVTAEANRVKEPWFFHWHKRGFWPWSWELVQMHNDGVDYGRGGVAP